MRKKILLVFCILLVIQFAQARCQDQAACFNQDNQAFCNPDDSSCSYKSSQEVEEHCQFDAISSDPDTDGDAWTDLCDSFPEDSNEWIDMDADGVGSNLDCDDYDPTIGDCTSEGNPDEPQEEDNNNTEDIPSATFISNSGGTTFCTAKWECTDWSKCENEQKFRTCTRINACGDDSNKPDETSPCVDFMSETPANSNDLEAEAKLQNSTTANPITTSSDENGKVDPDSKKETSLAALDSSFEPSRMALLLFLFLLLLAVLLWRQKNRIGEILHGI